MVCESGGAQTRSLREVFIFIRTQLNLLLKLKNKNNYLITYFIKVLTGPFLMPTSKYLYRKD